MAEPTDQLLMILKQNGQSLTKPRRQVFEVMQNQEPQTMAQIVATCKEINRASVYRTIALFEALGIVQRLQIGWKYKLELSADFHYHHHHLTCTSCGQIIAFEEDLKFERYLNKIAGGQNFLMHGHQLEIQGLCAACQKKDPGLKITPGSVGSLTLPLSA